MNSLPFEIFELIINKINIYDRIKLRSVCKRWSFFILNMRPKYLVVINKFEGLVTQRWFDTNQQINFGQNVLSNGRFNFLLSKSCEVLSNSVKELALYNLNSQNGSKNLELIVNSFKQVNRLDMYDIVDLDCTTRLKLPELEVACLDRLQTNFIIESNKLSKLKFHASSLEEKNVELTNPLKLEHLETDELYTFINKFKNLKFIYLMNEIKQSSLLIFLDEFREIKEVHLECKKLHFPELLSLNNFRSNQFVIYNFGLRVDCLEGMESFRKMKYKISLFKRCFESDTHLNWKSFEIYIQNYSKISNEFRFVTRLTFDEIESQLQQTPVDFFKRLTMLNDLLIQNKLDNCENFFKFIENCHPFPHLTFEKLALSNSKSTLDQSFFDRLSDKCWFIQSLILEGDANVENFDFIFKLKYLNTLRINQPISVDLVKKICTNLKLLENFFYLNENRHCSIKYSHEEDQFKLRLGSSAKFKFSDINNIIELLK